MAIYSNFVSIYVKSSLPMLRNHYSVSFWIKLFTIQLTILSGSCLFQRASSQLTQQGVLSGQPGQLPLQPSGQSNGQNVLHDDAKIQDRKHIKEHLGAIINEPDLSKMSEEEAQFYYFKSHDTDHNNKLDGSELIKSIIHWHAEEHKNLGQSDPQDGTRKIFTDSELANMIDPILQNDDRNQDGYIDYPEFVAAQKTRGSTT